MVEQRHPSQWYPLHFLIFLSALSQQQLQRQAVIYVIDRYQKPLQNIMAKRRRAAAVSQRGSR